VLGTCLDGTPYDTSVLQNCTGTGIAGSLRGPRRTRGYGDKVHRGLTVGMGPITRGHGGMGSTTCGDTAGTVCVHRCAPYILLYILPSERSFSLAGRTLEDGRNMLSAESVDGLLFLHGL